MSETAISQALVAWFLANRRDLPWRRTKNPYHIWVSEIMLQQTQVITVIPYYERFLAQFPTPAALAAVPTERVLKAWEGLGYYSRARNLQAGAAKVVAEHGGVVPGDWDAVRALPGVGDYTAGAILSIAFGLPVPAVDGNVLRVLSRIHRVADDIAKLATKRLIEARARALLPAERPGDLNEALMELGATICTPAKPQCESCPVAAFCEARAAGEQDRLPNKTKKAPAKQAVLAVGLIERDGRVLLVPRPEEGIWGGLWGFPSVEAAAGEDPAAVLAETLGTWGLAVGPGEVGQTVRHTLTHRQLTMPVVRTQWVAGELPEVAGAWVLPEELGHYPLPVPMQKIAKSLEPGPLFRIRSDML